MKVLILNASPKSRGSASKFYSSLLRLSLLRCEVKTCPLRGARDAEQALSLLSWAEAVVISAPLYVDAAPAHIIAFLEQAEKLCEERELTFHLYALSNCGFIEGHQNELHLHIYEAWCRRSGITWGGGLGIGGGVILRWMCMLTPLFTAVNTVQLVLLAQSVKLTVVTVLRCYSSTIVTIVMCVHALVCLSRMGSCVRQGSCRGNLYTRCLLPSFLFIPISDIFMASSALLHGHFPHALLRKPEVKYNDEKERPL